MLGLPRRSKRADRGRREAARSWQRTPRPIIGMARTSRQKDPRTRPRNTSTSATVTGTSSGQSSVTVSAIGSTFRDERAQRVGRRASVRANRRAPRPIGPSTVAAILGSEPWRECGTIRPFRRTTESPRRATLPISTGVATRATSLTGSHDRLEAESRKQVKAASRRSRARGARALTGLGWPGRRLTLPSDHGSARRRGAGVP